MDARDCDFRAVQFLLLIRVGNCGNINAGRSGARRFFPFLERLGGRLAGAGLSANAVTIVRCIIGLVGAAAIAGRLYILGMFLCA